MDTNPKMKVDEPQYKTEFLDIKTKLDHWNNNYKYLGTCNLCINSQSNKNIIGAVGIDN